MSSVSVMDFNSRPMIICGVTNVQYLQNYHNKMFDLGILVFLCYLRCKNNDIRGSYGCDDVHVFLELFPHGILSRYQRFAGIYSILLQILGCVTEVM